MTERAKAYSVLLNTPDASIIDSHSHAGFDATNIVRRRYPIAQGILDMVRKMDANGVSHAAVFPAPSDLFWFDARGVAFDANWEPSREPAERFPYEHANRAHFSEVELFGRDRIMPFANVLPGVKEEEQIDLLREFTSTDQLFGLKFHSLATHTPLSSFVESLFARFAQDHSLPVMFHSGPDEYSRPEQALDVAEELPDLRICIAHAGDFEATFFNRLRAGRSENLFVDVAPHITNCHFAQQRTDGEVLDLAYEDPLEVLAQVYDLIPDRVLWGTDEPWTTVTDDANKKILVKVTYEDEVALLNRLPDQIRRSMSYVNPMRYLFGEDGSSHA